MGMLRQTIEYLARHWNDDSVGLVACGVFMDGVSPVFGTSLHAGSGTWFHAEYVAIQKFLKTKGAFNAKAYAVVTMSPCTAKDSKSRVGRPCAHLLRSHGISQVWVGAVDPKAAPLGRKNYADLGLDVRSAGSTSEKAVCRRLRDLFYEYGDRVNVETHMIKREEGEFVFEPMSYMGWQ